MDKGVAGISGLTRASERPKYSRRQRSLPSNSSTDLTRRPPDITILQPASPEIISSLIHSLSSISAPANDHFESLPNIDSTKSAPSSPNPNLTDFPLITGPGGYVYKRDPSSPTNHKFSANHGSYTKSREPSPLHLIYQDDAATPPIVRTSKSPSGFSPMSASTRNSIVNRVGPVSRPSQTQNRQAVEEAQGISGLGTDAGSRDTPATEEPNWDAVNELSRNFKGSPRQSLEERSCEHNWNEKRTSARVIQGIGPSLEAHHTKIRSQGSRSGSPNVRGDRDIGDSPASPRIPSRASSICASDKRLSKSSAPDSTLEELGFGHIVPTRESSWHHSRGAVRRKRRSYRSEQEGDLRNDRDLHIGEEDIPEFVSIKVSDDPEADEVSKRIKQLKAQKILRDLSPTATDIRDLSPSNPQSDDRTSLVTSPSVQVQPLSTHTLQIEQSSMIETPLSSPEVVETHALSHANAQKFDQLSNLPSTSLARRTSRSITHTKPAMEPQKVQVGTRRTSLRVRRLSRPSSPIPFDKHKRNVSSQSQLTRHSHYDDRPASTDAMDAAVDEYLSAPRLTQKIHLPQTGRVISFSEVGDPIGSVVFCCVGMGLTRYVTAFYDELALTLKLRLITPDRPGVGESDAHRDGFDTPLGWPDDVLAICQHLKISKFSVLAHSAGAIYALATALRMPQHIRGRIHLLAPWIPPSQMSAMGSHQEPLPISALPYSQRILRSLPTTFLKVANSSFLSTTSASITTSLPKSPRRSNRKSLNRDTPSPVSAHPPDGSRSVSPSPRPQEQLSSTITVVKRSSDFGNANPDITISFENSPISEKERKADYDTRLTHAIWSQATTNANPAVDLLVCLERRQPIGFRYVDITKAVVIHHGSRDTRVPVENVKWLGKTMRRCEVRVLEGEGHGLMASAAVMGSVLVEMAKEWEDWNTVVRKGAIRRPAIGQSSTWS